MLIYCRKKGEPVMAIATIRRIVFVCVPKRELLARV